MGVEDFKNYDCAGLVTKYGVECTDGRVIERGSFSHMDGAVVPLVYQHQRKSPDALIGKVLLKEYPDGVRGFTLFNSTKSGQHMKACVEHGDIDSYSIFATDLCERGLNVKRGNIKEVSLVIAGANPGAHIEQVSMAHGDADDGEAIVFSGERLEETFGGSFDHADDNSSGSENMTSEDNKTIEEIYNTAMAKLTEKEQETLMYVFGEILDAEKGNTTEGGTAQQSAINENEEEDPTMKNNVFESQATANLEHSALQQSAVINNFALNALKKACDTGVSSFRSYLEHAIPESKALQHAGILDELSNTMEAINMGGSLQHADGDEPAAQTYGIKNIDLLFPDAKAISDKPEFINRRTEWVNEILTKTSHRPFARIKSLFADITAEEARAKGYTKGDQKDDEVFELLTRETYPATVYKENRLDRDDVIDATTIDVIAFLKEEMRIKYDEEVARAMLMGDGRSANAKHKIKEDKIRPVLTDADLFTIKYEVTFADGASAADKADILLDESILSFEDYRGTGNTVMFIDPTMYRQMMVLKDDIGNRKYKNPTEIAVAAGVGKIMPCPYMKNLTRTKKVEGQADVVYDVHAITLDLSDYVFGSDKGGSLSFFDDFDINFNKMIYLMEGRMSGALVKPYSAIVLETQRAAG